MDLKVIAGVVAGILIPAAVGFYKIIRSQTLMRSELLDHRSFLIAICNELKIACPTLKDRIKV